MTVDELAGVAQLPDDVSRQRVTQGEVNESSEVLNTIAAAEDITGDAGSHSVTLKSSSCSSMS